MTAGGISRVSDQMRVNTLLSNLRSNNLQSSVVQQQLATGDRLLQPSTDPDAASQAMSLQRLLDQQEQVMANLSQASSIFNQTDTGLDDAAGLLLEANVIASDSISATAEERESSARLIQSLIDSMVDVANRRVGDTYIFGGAASTTQAFYGELDGVRYAGSDSIRTADLGGADPTAIGLTGAEVFDIDDAGMAGYQDLTPAMTADTRLADLQGSADKGIRLDVVSISDGTNTVRVDLTGADRIGDILDKINTAGGGVITASLAPGGTALQIDSTAPGADLTVVDSSGGFAARDLGIFQTTGQGATLTGGNVHPTITTTTRLADLAGGAGLDLASGLIITNGGASETIDFAADDTVGDMLNRINNADVGVLAEINADGDGINIVNQISGSQLRIGENGGSTADDLGVRTLRAETDLSELRDGRGVRRIDGKTDMVIASRDGSSFEVDLSAAVTIDDVIAEINAAATAAGVSVTASVQTVGNGIELTDASGGAGSLVVSSINGGAAAEDLGLAGSVDADTLAGDDVNPVRTGGVFSDLIQLRDALLANDVPEITRIAGRLEDDRDHLVSLRARMGGLVQDLESRADREEELQIENLAMLSELKDTDFAAAITEFQALQNALQANFMTSSTMLNLSLLDFLR